MLQKVYKDKLKKSVAENRRAKTKFEEKLACNIKNDTKSFFAYANANRKANRKIGPLRDENQNVIDNNKCAADHINKYFASVFVEEDLINMPVPNQFFKGSIGNSLSNIEVNVDIVINKLNALNVSKSHGPNEVHGKLLLELREEIAPSLVKLFNASIESGVAPQDFMDATVVPLHKK